LPTADDAVAYAPCVYFERDEGFPPADVDAFRRAARFGQSNFEGRRDRGWHKQRGWVEVDEDGDAWRGEDWPNIVAEIDEQAPEPAPGRTRVTRPYDEENVFGAGSRSGFFLQVKGRVDRDAHRSWEPQTAIYFDRTEREIDGAPVVGIHYWFFYALNWNVVLTHEGDWEHVTLYFEPGELDARRRPSWVYYASHDGGWVFPRDRVEWVDATHPKVFVSRYGHPCYPRAPVRFFRTARLRPPWRTWEGPVLDLAEQEWRAFDGAWGGVGLMTHLTGPLGPWFKRTRDTLKVKK
jgi:hypothetical protein